MAHPVFPRVPANEQDVYLTSRDNASVLESIVRLTGDLPRVDELQSMQMMDENAKKINELVRCFNNLLSVISGK